MSFRALQTISAPASLLLLVLAGAAPLAHAAAQATVAWSGPPDGVSVAVDADDAVFTVRYDYALGAEMTVAKRDADGNLLWTSSFDQTDSTKWEEASWITTDGDGSAIVCGTLKSGYSNPVNAASIVMKFAPDGAFLWRRVYESSFDGSWARKCLVDADDNVYVLGMGAGPSGFVAKIKKFAPDGTPLWSWFDSAGIGAPVNFKLAPDLSLVVSARSIFGSIDGFAKVSLDGASLWALTGVQSLTAGDCAGDVLGNTYVVHGDYSPSGGTVVKKLDPSGALLWARTHPSAGFRIEVGNDDAAVVSGFPNSGTAGAAFFKLDAEGKLLWTNLDADGPLGLLLHAQMLLDDSNDAYLAAGTLFEMAVCKVRSDGTSAWTVTTPGGYARGIALGKASNDVFVTGGATARVIDHEEGVWLDLGFASPVDSGPDAHGSGVLAGGAMLRVHVEGAPASAPGALVVGTSAAFLPFFGGTLVPSPSLVLPVVSDAFGRATVAGPVGARPPAGTTLWFQAWFLEGAAPMTFQASNGLATSAP